MTPPPINIDGTNENYSNVTIDGQDVEQITIDGQDVLAAIPDSVDYQYDLIKNWSQGDDSVTDGVGSDPNMTVIGDPQDAIIGGKTGAKGDGSDDYGIANATVRQDETDWGIAFTINVNSDNSGVSELDNILGIYNEPDDNLFNVRMRDNNNTNFDLEVRFRSSGNDDIISVPNFADGNDHAVVINRTANGAGGIEIYVDDMTTDVSSVDNDAGQSVGDWSTTTDYGFLARPTGNNHIEAVAGVFEANSEPYSGAERQTFVSRRPEV